MIGTKGGYFVKGLILILRVFGFVATGLDGPKTQVRDERFQQRLPIVRTAGNGAKRIFLLIMGGVIVGVATAAPSCHGMTVGPEAGMAAAAGMHDGLTAGNRMP